MLDFSGKVAIVTGASRGIGRAIATTLASRGAHVIAAARDQNAAELARQAAAWSTPQSTTPVWSNSDTASATYPGWSAGSGTGGSYSGVGYAGGSFLLGVIALLLAAGAKGKRFCLPNSRVMIHQPMGGFQGQASDIEIHAKEILFLKGRLNEIMAKHTGQKIETIEKDTDRDNFLSAAQAVSYGLVDKVLTSRTEAPVQ